MARTMRLMMNDVSAAVLAQLESTAVLAALRAGDVLARGFRGSRRIDVRELHDLKIDADRDAEEQVLEVIRKAFPDHAILSEEIGLTRPSGGDAELLWIVDPLDGTVNYYHGIGHFATSVAVWHQEPTASGEPGAGEPLVGVVYLPVAGELYCGVRGGGATVNGAPLRIDPSLPLQEAMVGINIPTQKALRGQAFSDMQTLAEHARKVRWFGATAVELAQLAAGRLGAFVQRGVRLWDFAGAATIVREAGGVFQYRELGSGQWHLRAGGAEALREIQELIGDV